MTYEELKITIDLNGHENILSSIGRKCLDDSHWFIICDDGDCHLFDENGKEDDIKKVTKIYEDMIPKDIKKIVIPNSMTIIGNGAFWGCTNLMSVTISNNAMYIGGGAFYNCYKLSNMTIPDSVASIGNDAFFSCFSLTNVTIPNNVMYIGEYAFADCGLKSVIIPNTAIRIGLDTFFGCDDLTNIIIDKPIEQVKAMKNYPWGIKDESIIKCN